MDAEQVLRLLDSFWFETTILTNKTTSKFHDPISQTKTEEVLSLDTKALDIRFYSDQNLSTTGCVFCDSPSSNSLSRLRTIPSEKEIRQFSIGTSSENHEKEDTNIKRKQRHSHGRSLRKSKTRSLTELEFKELKGFMDLGFVFSEEDKDSKLVSLIPGLQRLGREEANEDEEKQNIDESVSSDEPYLSEAWGVLDQRNPLQNWRIPERVGEIDMKHNLKFWAHTVASSVR